MQSFSAGDELVGFLEQGRAATALQERVALFFVESRGDVYRYLLTLGLYPPQAQDVTQDVFLRLYGSLKRGEFIENERAWIFRVAHNQGLKVRARQSSVQPFDGDLETRIAEPGADPETALLERERSLRLHKAIESLSEQQKRCLFLRMEGLRYPDIAAVMGLSNSSVGEFLRRAVGRLKSKLHEVQS